MGLVEASCPWNQSLSDMDTQGRDAGGSGGQGGEGGGEGGREWGEHLVGDGGAGGVTRAVDVGRGAAGEYGRGKGF